MSQQAKKSANMENYYKLKCGLLDQQNKSLLKQVDFLEDLLAKQDEVMKKLGTKLSDLEADQKRQRETEGQLSDLMNRIDRLGRTLEEMWRQINHGHVNVHEESDSVDDGFVESSE